MVVTFKARKVTTMKKWWKKNVCQRSRSNIYFFVLRWTRLIQEHAGCRHPRRYTNHRAAGVFSSRCSQWYRITFPSCPPLLLILRFFLHIFLLWGPERKGTAAWQHGNLWVYLVHLLNYHYGFSKHHLQNIEFCLIVWILTTVTGHQAWYC